MSGTEIPADLIRLKREFYEAQRALPELSNDTEAWRATHARMTALAIEIHRHEAFQGLSAPDRLRLDTAASKAAREQLPPLPEPEPAPEPAAKPDQDSAGG